MEGLAPAGLLLTAVALGVTHGIEPDHVAAIGALTRERRGAVPAAVTGGAFALGHVALVTGWVAAVTLLLGATPVPPVVGDVGTVVVGAVLALLGVGIAVAGARQFIHAHGHEHDDVTHAHLHVHRPRLARNDGRWGRTGTAAADHRHDHGPRAALSVGMVGALFTLSPPVSMLAFLTVAIPSAGRGLVVGIVLVYAVAIAGTMAAVAGAAGHLRRRLQHVDGRLRAVGQMALALAVLGVAAAAIAAGLPALLG